MNEREALKLALEALETGGWNKTTAAITAIKEALAQPEQEPVGKFAKFSDGLWKEVTEGSAGVLLYTSPPHRKPLTDEEIAKIASTPCAVVGSYVHTFARAIEAAHGIKE